MIPLCVECFLISFVAMLSISVSSSIAQTGAYTQSGGTVSKTNQTYTASSTDNPAFLSLTPARLL
jgi:hypothetical protein